MIRDVAKRGYPESVTKLMDQGIDLETVYAPYKRTMASVLELNPEVISFDDPVLRSAIGPDKDYNPVYIYDIVYGRDTASSNERYSRGNDN